MSDLNGKIVGQYQIDHLIGKGGMANVYRAVQLSMNRPVAIKVIKADLSEHPDFLERFRREARTIASLSHPHILKVFDYGQHEQTVYLVMELLTGGTLSNRIAGGPLPLPSTLHILDEIASALDYAHARGIVHRDLKPQNVLLDEAGHTYLSDFGLAKLLDSDSRLTQSGAVMGTPAYMSPEQWSGQTLDARSDIYALGVILFEMLTGRVPFDGDTPFVLMNKHIFDSPPSVADLVPGLPPGAAAVVARAMSKAPNERYSSAGELAAAFRAAVQNAQPETVVPASATSLLPKSEPAAPASPPNRAPLVLGALALIVLIAAGAFFLSRPPAQPLPSPTLPAASPTLPSTQTKAALVVTQVPPTVAATAVPATVAPTLPPTTAPTIAPTAGPTKPPATVTALPPTQPSTVAASPTVPISSPAAVSGLTWDWAASTPLPPKRVRITGDNLSVVEVTARWGRGAVFASTVSHNGRWLVTVDREGTRVFDLHAPNSTPKDLTNVGDAFQIEFSANDSMLAAFTCGDDCETFMVRPYDLPSGNPLPIISFPRKYYGAFVLFPFGKTLATGGETDPFTIWDIASGAKRGQLTDQTGIARLALSPDGTRLAIGKIDHTVVLWDMKNNAKVATLEGHTQEVTALAFSPDSRLLATGSDKQEDSNVRIWESQTGKAVATLEDTDRTYDVYGLSLAYSPDGTLLAAGSGDSVRLWDASKNTLASTLAVPSVRGLNWVSETRLIVRSLEGGILSLDRSSGQLKPVLPQSQEGDLSYSPDGKVLASSVGRYVYIRDASTGAVLHILEGARKGIQSLAYSPDGKVLAASADNQIYLWDAKTNESQPPLFSADLGVRDLQFSADGSILAGVLSDGTVRLWDMKTHASLRSLEGGDGINTVSLSPDGTLLAGAANDKSVIVWSVKTGEITKTLTGHTERVTRIAYSPDGKWLASASDDKTVRLWTVQTGESQPILTLDQPPNVLVFSLDSTLLFAGGSEMRAWSVSTSKDLGSRSLYVDQMVFSPDGTLVALTGSGGITIGVVR